MHRGIRLGRIFGINIRVDWSWLIIFLLITWNLSAAFNEYQPDWSWGAQWGLAILASGLFFASLLAHEMAHSLMARARGVPVRSITLFLFGGVSNIERDPDSPQSEFLITIVGPLTSFAIGIVLLLAGSVIAEPLRDTVSDPEAAFESLGPLTMLLLWLGSINMLLGAFNLIPGFPLDGGRLLRSTIWAATGNLRQATRWASWTGQGIAFLFIFLGISMAFGAKIPFFGTGLVGGLWLAFIGWFLNSAAVQSYQQIVVQDILEDVPVARMMRSNPPTVAAAISVSEMVHDHVMKRDDYAFPVMEGRQLVGLATLDDVRAVPREQWSDTLVRQIMTPFNELVTTTTDEDATDAWQKLVRRDVRQLPVVHGQELAGLLRRRDIVRWLQFHSELGSN
ncbi:MAG: CBS domain-containing protein [Chloroflexi bacterium]|nr:CBS domain-containing protein [Chloroflexota bacterium]